MIRLIGAVLLIFCGWVIGFGLANNQKKHLRQLELLDHYLECLCSELEYTQSPLHEIAYGLSRHPVFDDFGFAQMCAQAPKGQSFSSAFLKATAENRYLFGEEVFACLESLSDQLGNFPVENQASSIAVCRCRIQQIIRETREKTAQNVKLFRSMGLLGGAAAVIILW